MGIRILLLFGVALTVQAQDDPLDVLRRVSHNVMETIDRSEYRLNGIFRANSCHGLAAEKKRRHLKRRLTAPIACGLMSRSASATRYSE
jgi:hypothetical protein